MKSKIISALIVFAGICLPGCKDSFLERTPENSYTDENFYASDDALDAATAPLYNKAWFDYNSRSIMFLGSTRANDFYSPYAFPEFTTFQVTALNLTKPLISDRIRKEIRIRFLQKSTTF